MIRENLIYQYQKFQEFKWNRLFDGRFAMMFHQVEEDTQKWYDRRYAITVSGFQSLIGKLQATGYEIVSPYDLLNPDGRKKTVLTFDDVFEGVYKEAYPFLREQGIPFVVFPAVNMLRKAGYVNENMLLDMASGYEGCYVGAHSLSHCNLRNVSKEQSREEIIGSGEILEGLLGKKVDLFAYPYGSIDAVGRRERKTAGEKYRIAFGTISAGVTVNTDHRYVPRINVNEENYDCTLPWNALY